MAITQSNIVEILRNQIDPDVKVGFQVSDADKMLVFYMKVDNISLPITAMVLTDKSKEGKQKVAKKLLKEAYKIVSNKRTLRKLVDRYFEVVEQFAIEQIQDEVTDLRGIDDQSYNTNENEDDIDFQYDDTSQANFLDIDDIRDKFFES